MFDVLGGDLQITKKSLMTLDEVLKAVDGKLLSNTQENDFNNNSKINENKEN